MFFLGEPRKLYFRGLGNLTTPKDDKWKSISKNRRYNGAFISDLKDENMSKIAAPPEIGRKVQVQPGGHGGSWVQTERAGHEAWARLGIRSPIASAILHTLVARMGNQNAVVISQKTLAGLIGVTDRSVRSAVQLLTAERWMQVVRLNGPGTVCAYVVNSAVAWGEKREKLSLSVFSANVVADAEDQFSIDHTELRQIPTLFAGERQLPTGPGEAPPSQPSIEGLEPDLPSIQAELEARGQMRIDPDTGEIQ